ncbi:Uncharacterised protein [Vibrio cholerae]|nr:Uncharacterised protein [Vibrio cholerae]
MSAIPITEVPPGANSTRFSSPPAISVSFSAQRIAVSWVKRRGAKGKVCICSVIFSITCG